MTLCPFGVGRTVAYVPSPSFSSCWNELGCLLASIVVVVVVVVVVCICEPNRMLAAVATGALCRDFLGGLT